ncbi:MAG: hypothetical protein ACI89U_001716, partial [Gammaproteobacteria bacterium]
MFALYFNKKRATMTIVPKYNRKHWIDKLTAA